MALGTAYIAYHGAEGGYQPDRSSAKPVGDGLPEERRGAQDHNLDTRYVGCSSEGDSQIDRKQLEGRDHSSSYEGGHHRMESNEKQIDVFLPWSALFESPRDKTHTFHEGQLRGSAGSIVGIGTRSSVLCRESRYALCSGVKCAAGPSSSVAGSRSFSASALCTSS